MSREGSDWAPNFGSGYSRRNASSPEQDRVSARTYGGVDRGKDIAGSELERTCAGSSPHEVLSVSKEKRHDRRTRVKHSCQRASHQCYPPKRRDHAYDKLNKVPNSHNKSTLCMRVDRAAMWYTRPSLAEEAAEDDEQDNIQVRNGNTYLSKRSRKASEDSPYDCECRQRASVRSDGRQGAFAI